MRAIAALQPQVVAAEGELGRGDQRLGLLVFELVPLEVEEQQRGLQRRQPLADLLHQRAHLGRERVDRERQRGVGAGAPGEVGDRLELAHRLGEPDGVELRHLPPVALGERLGPALGLVELLERPLGAAVLDQRLEVPAGGGEGFVGRGHGGGVAHGTEDMRRRRSAQAAAPLRSLKTRSTSAPAGRDSICGRRSRR